MRIPTLTAVAGTDFIQLVNLGLAPNFPSLPAGASCSVTLEVTTDIPGVFVNVSQELTETLPPDNISLSSGFAVAESPMTSVV